MTETVERVTEHGTVSYEVVTCDSCEREVSKDDANRFIIGDVVQQTEWSHKDTKEYEIDSRSMTTGWACPDCSGEPISFPSERAQSAQDRLERVVRVGVRLFLKIPLTFGEAVGKELDLDDTDTGFFKFIFCLAWVFLIALLL